MKHNILKCGTLSKLLWYPFLLSVSFAIRTSISKVRNKESETKSEIIEYDSPFFFSLIATLTYLLGGVLELISQYRQKQDDTNKKQVSKVARLNSVLKKIKVMTRLGVVSYYLVIVFTSFCLSCVFVFTILIGYYSTDPNLYTYMRVCIIIFDLLLSKIVLKYPIYRHQLLSIGFMIIGLGLVSSFLFTESLESALLCVFNYIVYAGFDVQMSLLSNTRHHSVFRLMVMVGIISSVIFMIILSFTWMIPCVKEGFMPCNNNVIEDITYTVPLHFRQDMKRNTILMIGYILSHFLYTVCLVKTLYYYSPLHRCMADAMGVFFLWVVDLIRGILTYQTTSLVGYILIVISTLIYNEIIILKFCSLGEYTRMEIIKRSERENKSFEMPRSLIVLEAFD